MTPSIPASQLVSVIPGVLSAGGNPLSLNGVMVTQNAAVPIGSVLAFVTLADVEDYFGPGSAEAHYAAIYFNGFTNATTLPGTLFFAPYNVAAAAAYLRSGPLNLTLAELQALSGTVILSIDGKLLTSASINLAGATSYSNAAALIQTGLRQTGNSFTGTGTVTSGSPTLTINSTTFGLPHVGDTIVGTDIPGATTIIDTTGYDPIAGTGTVTMSANASGGAGPEAITVTNAAVTVAYESQQDAFQIGSGTTGVNSSAGFATGTLSAGIKLTQATGAVLSAGAAAATPASAMDAVTLLTQNWATFMTLWEPLKADKLLFADWVNASGERYAYAAWDSDASPTVSNDATSSFGNIVDAQDYDGVVAIYDATGDIAAFFLGMVASVDYNAPQGAINYAAKGQAGLAAAVTNATVANNLKANGYNFYADYATANQQFVMFQTGHISGKWIWADAYIDQIYLNSQLQLALMTLLTGSNRLPYNALGYGKIYTSMLAPIQQGLLNGSIQPGVTLSPQQVQQINTAAGTNGAANVVQNVGWFLAIQAPAAQVRTARGSPDITLWYTDGGSIQTINLASIDVE